MTAALRIIEKNPKILFELIPLLISASDAAQRMGTSSQWVQSLIKRKKITAYSIGGVWIVYWPSVIEYYERRNIKPPEHQSP